jgi:hypothetical protein
MNCPNCNSGNVKQSLVTEWLPYGKIDKAFQATFPVMQCECGFGWRDSRSEEAIDKAMDVYLDPAAKLFSRADEQALLSEAEYYEGKLRAAGKTRRRCL